MNLKALFIESLLATATLVQTQRQDRIQSSFSSYVHFDPWGSFVTAGTPSV